MYTSIRQKLTGSLRKRFYENNLALFELIGTVTSEVHDPQKSSAFITAIKIGLLHKNSSL